MKLKKKHLQLGERFTCDNCKSIFNRDELDIHHSSMTSWYCTDCADKLFAPRFICDICDRNLHQDMLSSEDLHQFKTGELIGIEKVCNDCVSKLKENPES